MLGIPNDTIQAIQNLHNGTAASSTDCSKHIQTFQIDFKQGGTHGDPLSPLIFKICLDSLLKWLETDNRGYNTPFQANKCELYISN